MFRYRNRGSRSNQQRPDRKVEKAVNTDENNLVIKCFREYAEELNEKHDRQERIVKHSRDITIESKRLIFLLHTIDSRKSNADKVLAEAFPRLVSLCTKQFASIAKELHNIDPYQYARAYSAGLQEFIEAFTYYNYLQGDHIMNWNSLEKKLTYTIKADGEWENTMFGKAVDDEQPEPAPDASVEGDVVYAKLLVQPLEFMLGLADLSGEIMRKCINSLGNGDVDECNAACNFIKSLYSGYLRLGSFRNREMSRKVYTMHQSVLKVEKVCYNVKVRGSEAAKWSSSDALEKQHEDDDEGFANY